MDVGVGVSRTMVSITLLTDFSLGVSTGKVSGVGGTGGEASRGRDASSSRDFCFACFGGVSITTAKSGMDFRGLSGDLLTPLSATPFGLGAVLSFNDWLSCARLMSGFMGFGRVGLARMCLTSMTSWSSSAVNAMGSGEETGERPGEELRRGRLIVGVALGELGVSSRAEAPLSRWSWAKRSASDVNFFKVGLGFPWTIALGTRAAIFARFCSTFSWASLSCEDPPLWGSESLLRLLGRPAGCSSGSLSSTSFVDGGRVIEIPFDFTVG